MDLQQFVPSQVCLSCNGCCRFKDEASVWRPRPASDEIEAIRKNGLAEKILGKEQSPLSPDGRIKTVCSDAEHLCSFFEA